MKNRKKRIDEKKSGQAIYKEFLYYIYRLTFFFFLNYIWIDLTSVFRRIIHVKLKISNGR